MTEASSSLHSRALGKLTVGSIMSSAARRFRDREALFCSGTGRRFSFREINERCNRLANALAELGFGKPDVVAFLCNNRAELAEIYFALAKLGLVGVPLNYRLAPVEIASLMQAMGATALLFETRFLAAADYVRAKLEGVRTFVAIGPNGPDWALGYEPLIAGAPATEPEVEVEESDPYYFNLTSGTTGLPKAYTLSHYNNASIGVMFGAYDLTSRDVLMTLFPAFGRVGFAWILAGLMFGARNVLADFHPAQALQPDRTGKGDDLQPGSDYGGDAARRSQLQGPRPRFGARRHIRRLDAAQSPCASA